jgi:hypothetical protein
MVLYLWCICLDLPLYILLCTLSIADWLSQWTQIAGIGFGQYKISFEKFQSHLASSLALLRAINSDSIMNLTINVCLDNFHDTAAPSSVKTYPPVDFKSLMLDI